MSFYVKMRVVGQYTQVFYENGEHRRERTRNVESILPATDRAARMVRGAIWLNFTEWGSRCVGAGAHGIGGEGCAATVEQASLNGKKKLENGEHETIGKVMNKRGGG